MSSKLADSKPLYILWLLIFPPMTIELLSGSTPPTLYFKPLTIFFFTICYGMVFILLREMKVRWYLTWQFLFLIPLMGIYIEGFFMQSFYNSGHVDLGHLSNFGVYLGVQWPWTIYLIIMHGIFSVVIPLFITDIFFPTMKDMKILNRKLIIIFCVFILALQLLQTILIANQVDPMYQNYTIDVLGNVWSFIICIGLIGLAYLTRNIKLKKTDYSSKKFSRHFHGFIYMILLLIATHFFAEINITLVIISQLILTILLIIYCFKCIYKTNNSLSDYIPLYNGTIAFFILFAILQGYNIVENIDPTAGMQYVGYAFLILSIFVNITGKLKEKR